MTQRNPINRYRWKKCLNVVIGTERKARDDGDVEIMLYVLLSYASTTSHEGPKEERIQIPEKDVLCCVQKILEGCLVL
jgi:hypothetical protein